MEEIKVGCCCQCYSNLYSVYQARAIEWVDLCKMASLGGGFVVFEGSREVDVEDLGVFSFLEEAGAIVTHEEMGKGFVIKIQGWEESEEMPIACFDRQHRFEYNKSRSQSNSEGI